MQARPTYWSDSVVSIKASRIGASLGESGASTELQQRMAPVEHSETDDGTLRREGREDTASGWMTTRGRANAVRAARNFIVWGGVGGVVERWAKRCGGTGLAEEGD